MRLPITNQPPHTPLDAVRHPHPYPYYRQLALTQPFYRDAKLGCWVAASYAAVQEVMASPLCGVRPMQEPVPAALQPTPLAAVFAHLLRMTDTPRHAPLRLAIGQTLASLDPTQLGAVAQRLSQDYLAQQPLRAASLDGLAWYLPVASMASLLGIPQSQLAAVANWIAQFVRALAPEASPIQRQIGIQALAALQALFNTLQQQASGLLQQLIQQCHAQGLSSVELITANAIGLMMQSLDAGAGLISSALWYRACGQALEDDAAWTQLLQTEPAIHNTRRFVREGGELCGQALSSGESVLVVLAAAQQDPAWPNAQAACFGHGPRCCPGQQAALWITQAALSTLPSQALASLPLAQSQRFYPLPNVRIRLYGESA